MIAKPRLDQVLSCLQPRALSRSVLGTLSLGNVSVSVLESAQPTRVPASAAYLDLNHPVTAEHLQWILKKTLLNQDVFLYGPPGPYSRQSVSLLQLLRVDTNTAAR